MWARATLRRRQAAPYAAHQGTDVPIADGCDPFAEADVKRFRMTAYFGNNSATSRLVFALTALMLSAGCVGAQRIGAIGTGGNGLPFTFTADTRYQQVYASPLFGGGTITGVRFFRTVDPSGTGDIANARFTFSLSTTSARVNGLNTLDLSRNVGNDNVQVLDQFLGNLNVPYGGSLTLMFTRGFVYDPSRGNLLLDIAIAPLGGPGFVLFDAHNGDFGDQSSRAMRFASGYESYGLVTEFLTTPFEVAPEPETWALMCGGLSMLLIIAKQARRRLVTRR